MSFEATKAVVQGSKQKGGARLVLTALAFHADGDGWAWPSIATLGTETGLCERAVRYALRRLEVANEVLVERGFGRGNLSRYYLMGQSLPLLASEEKGQSTTEKGQFDAQKGQSTTEKGQPAAPELNGTKQELNGRVPGDAPRPAPKPRTPNKFGEFVDALKAAATNLGQDPPKLRGDQSRAGKAIRESPYPAGELARAVLAYESGDWTDAYLARTGSKLHDLVQSAGAFLEPQLTRRANATARNGAQGSRPRDFRHVETDRSAFARLNQPR